jgi:hypothetical protein
MKTNAHSDPIKPDVEGEPIPSDDGMRLSDETVMLPTADCDYPEVGETPERPCGGGLDQFGNDADVERMIAEADVDNAQRRRGERAIFFADMRQAVRLHTALWVKGYEGDRFIAFAKRTGNLGESKARRLARLAPFYDEVIKWAEDGLDRARGRGAERRFKYPSWNSAYREFLPKEPKPTLEISSGEDDPGLAGDTPEPTPENLQATIELMSEQLTTAASQRDEAERRCAELEVEVAQLTAEIAILRKTVPTPDGEPTKTERDAIRIVKLHPQLWKGNGNVASRTKGSVERKGWVSVDQETGVPRLTQEGEAICTT